MTCGIYLLKFKETDKVYIGQSIHIEQRFIEHKYSFSKETASIKLQEAFKIYGIPTLEILVECSKNELNDIEDESIDIFNSVNNGFNSLYSAKDTPYGKGTSSGNSKYTREQILFALTLLKEIHISRKDASDISGVSLWSLHKIISGIQHTWIKEEYPDLVLKILETEVYRLNSANKTKVIWCKTNLSAKAKGIIYPKIKSPEGMYYQIDNLQEFARTHGLAKSSLHRVLHGKAKQVKGWKICPEDNQ